MIYFDHAATSYPKTEAVRRASDRALRCFAANPGRSGYPMALATGEQLYLCRERVASLFGLSDPRRVVFVPSCTVALNTFIKGILAQGGRIAVSDLEHNAVIRPLHALSPRHPVYDTAHVTVGDEEATVQAFRQAITPKTKAILCTHASNVLGCALPIVKLAKLAHDHGILMAVDAAQSAGHLLINMERDEIDCVCTAGHKGLGGTMGTGLLLCRNGVDLAPLAEGGTGSDSLSLDQPVDWPDRMESGTPNVAGICALREGVEHILRVGVERIARREITLATALYEGLSAVDGITVYSPRPTYGSSTAVLSFCADRLSVEEVCARLASHGVAVRGGLHCAPTAHRSIGTLPHGTVRLSLGVTNTMREVETFMQILKKIL